MNLLSRKNNTSWKSVRHAAWFSHLKLKPSFNYFHSTCLSRPPQTRLILLSTEAQMIKCTSSYCSCSLSLSLVFSVAKLFTPEGKTKRQADRVRQAGRQSVSIKLINNFMLLKQTAEPKREHNKFFCV